MRKPLAGILIHPWDIQDEGVQTVAETLRGLSISSAYIAVDAPAEQHPPQPVEARLTHNPKKKRYVSEGGRFYYDTDASYYINSIVTPKRSSDGDLAGYDVLEDTRPLSEAGINRYAWLTALHNGQFVAEARELSVVDITGEADEHWMCPNNSNTTIQLLEMLNEIQQRYDLKGVLLDNFWWKYPHTYLPSLEAGLVCFCEHCRNAMEDAGINPRQLIKTLAQIPRIVRNINRSKLKQIGGSDPGTLLGIVGLPTSEGGGYADVMSVLFEDQRARERLPELSQADGLGIFRWIQDNLAFLDWLDFKADSLVNVLVSARELVRANDPDFELGLGIWSPRSSWTVCQSYTKLRDACDWLMPMVYHRLWGWYSVSVAEEIFQIVHPNTPRVFASYKQALAAWFKLAGYTARPLRSLIYNGLPASQIEKELVRARALAGPDTPLFAGLQLWEPGSRIPHSSESEEAARVCLSSQVEGIIIQAYGWAPMPNLVAAGRAIGEFSRTQPMPAS